MGGLFSVALIGDGLLVVGDSVAGRWGSEVK